MYLVDAIKYSSSASGRVEIAFNYNVLEEIYCKLSEAVIIDGSSGRWFNQEPLGKKDARLHFYDISVSHSS